MSNIIIALSVAGVISASGATYLLQLEEHSQEVATNYTQHAYQRFEEYDRMLPGIVKWPTKR